jgi:tetratricopeptide (TPR) repeat protein
VSCFEDALSALQRLPEGRTSCEQAFDLRLDLRNALVPLGEQERIIVILCECIPLAEALDDHRRLGLLAGYMAQHLNFMSGYERAIASSQRALALATTLNDLALQIGAHLHLDIAYYAMDDSRQGIEFLSSRPLPPYGVSGCSTAGVPTQSC